MTIKQEMQFIQKIFPDAQINEVKAAYEYFHFIVDGVRFIVYPHRVKNTGNDHLRVRNGTPLLKDKFRALVSIIQDGKHIDCNYHVNNDHQIFQHYKKEAHKTFPQYQHYWENALKLNPYKEVS